jgi:hypothetical protein
LAVRNGSARLQRLRRLLKMLEKIKNIVKYVFFPLTALFAFIYYILNQNSELKNKVARNDAEKQMAEALTKLEKAKESADADQTESDSSYSDYKRALDEYKDSGSEN